MASHDTHSYFKLFTTSLNYDGQFCTTDRLHHIMMTDLQPHPLNQPINITTSLMYIIVGCKAYIIIIIIQLRGRYGPFETGSHIHEGTRQAYNSVADTAHSKQALTSTKERDKHTTPWQIRPIRNRLSHP